MSTETGSTLATEPVSDGTPNAAVTNQQPDAAQQTATQTSTTTPEASQVSDLYIDIDDGLKDMDSISKYVTDGKLNVRSLAMGYANAERLIGGDKVPVPKDGDEESLNRWYDKGGRPEAPDKYELSKPDLPEGIENLPYDDNEEKFWRELAHKNGLSQRQFESMWDAGVKSRLESVAEGMKALENGREEAANTLKKEHGEAYPAFLNSAKSVLQQFGDEDFNGYLEQTGLGNDPRLLRVFGKISKELNGASKLTDNDQNTGMTPADIDKAIADYRTKYAAELNDEQHPNHKQRVQEYFALFQKKHGNAPAPGATVSA